MFLFHWRKEGEHLHQGLSFYHPSDKHSAGCFLRIGNRMWHLRYSKNSKKFSYAYYKVNPNALREWEEHHGLRK
jgi:glycyl-tRNA synthetase alpha subunit